MLGPGEDLSVEEAEPAVLIADPGTECLRDRLQLRRSGHPGVQQLRRESRLQDAVGPHPAPVLPVLRVREAPGARGRCDVGEPGGPCPRQQATSGLRLAAVGQRSLLVEPHPLVEGRYRREPCEAEVVAVCLLYTSDAADDLVC